MEEKYINRIESFRRSLASFALVRTRDLSDDFVLSGAIQKFNITFDISWKVMKDILVSYYGIVDFATGSPRDTLKKAMKCELIDDDSWIDMMSDRNILAHDYDGEIAKDKITDIVEIYLPLMEKFSDTIDKVYS